jgi:hypothetical protein
MYNDDYVSSVPYRVMPPRKRLRSDIGEALDAARVTGPELREALDAAHGTAPDPAGPAGDLSWPGAPPCQRLWLRAFGRGLARVDVWILIVGIVGLIIVYLAWMKPH